MTAESVETAAQCAHLHGLGCDTGQGWFFARAVPAAAVPGLLGRTLGDPAGEQSGYGGRPGVAGVRRRGEDHPMTHPIRIGVQLQPQHADYAQIRDAVAEAEDARRRHGVQLGPLLPAVR